MAERVLFRSVWISDGKKEIKAGKNMRKKQIIACVFAGLFGVVLAGCGGNEGKQHGGNLTEMKTVEEILSETSAEDLIGKNDIGQFTAPFYGQQIEYNEGFLLREDGQGGSLPVKLMFPVAHILEVRSNDLKTLYEEEKDYTIEDGKLIIPETSSMKAIPDSEFFLPEGAPSDWLYNDKAGEDEGRAVTTDKQCCINTDMSSPISVRKFMTAISFPLKPTGFRILQKKRNPEIR